MRLIDAGAYFKKVCTYNETGCGSCVLQVKCPVDEPTVDAELVRHATWIPCAKSGLELTELMRKEGIKWYGFKCSACNHIRKGNALMEAIYCEHCGAKMDGDIKWT